MLPSLVYANSANFQQQATAQKLSESTEWLNLLHFKRGQSEIDDPTFFFSKNGKSDANAELLASIDALFKDKSDDINSVYCKFNARSTWLMEQLPDLKPALVLPQCKELNEEIKHLNTRSITLVFAASHMNSPASAFGHTFLRLEDDQNTPLTAYAVNYAAQTDESNGFIYAFKGMFGGYEGRYSILPYATKVQEYNDLEGRDIWEYKLNLTQEEVDRAVRHILEVRHVYADYFFFDENCSYNLLWLLQVARPGTDLTSQFNVNAIPVDTVRAIEDAGLIEKEVFRPSHHKRMLALAKNLHSKEAWTFINNPSSDVSLIQWLPLIEQASALELATTELKHQRTKDKITHEQYTRTLISLLKARSRLGSPLVIDIAKPASPKSSHLSNRFDVGVQQRSYAGETLNELTLGYKPSFHTLDDNETGHLAGAYISFFDIKLRANEQNTELEKFYLIDLRSYALHDVLFKPISWQVRFGAERLLDDKLVNFLTAGAGISLGNERTYLYTMLSPTIYYHDEWDSSLKLESGIVVNYSSMKLGLKLSKEWLDRAADIQQVEGFATYSFSSRWAANLSHTTREFEQRYTENKTSFNLLHYF